MVSTIIAKTNGNNRVIDFRDMLCAAQPGDYATMHQLGGKSKEGYPSVIKMVICDFSKGTGDKSVTVSVNLEPSLLYEWFEVCKAAVGESVLPMKKNTAHRGERPVMADNELGELWKAVSLVPRLARSGAILLSGVTNTLGKLVQKTLAHGSAELDADLGRCFKEARNCMKEPLEVPMLLTAKVGRNYSYTQDKVNIYKKQPDGYAPVSRLTVQHQCYRSQDGDAATYPWTLKIVNGEAVVSEKNTGATTFQYNTLRNTTEAYIQVSDRDMFRMMLRVTHFIDAWENANCLPLILNGEAQRQQELQGWHNQGADEYF